VLLGAGRSQDKEAAAAGTDSARLLALLSQSWLGKEDHQLERTLHAYPAKVHGFSTSGSVVFAFRSADTCRSDRLRRARKDRKVRAFDGGAL
jgi:hypothetical protein